MELKINELRIGNYVSHFSFEHQVESIHSKNKLSDKYRHIYFEDKTYDFFMTIKPIELNKEWLIKFGFKVFEFDNEKLNQYKYKNRIISIINGNFVDRSSFVVIKYVHQLQNLYFTLNGEELKVNE